MADVDDLSGRKLGEFLLRERLGEGGFGTVYRCEQRALRREAVVKILHPRLRHNDVVLQRFLREAQVGLAPIPWTPELRRTHLLHELML